MAAGLDTGDMISKVTVKIGDSNFSELHDKLAEAGSELLIRTLRDIEDGKASFEKQDDSLSSYAPMIGKQDGHIDFTKDPSFKNFFLNIIPHYLYFSDTLLHLHIDLYI